MTTIAKGSIYIKKFITIKPWTFIIFFLFTILFFLAYPENASATNSVISEKLFAEFKAGDLARKRIILKTLIRLNRKDIFPFLKNLVTHEDEYIRRYAFHGISNFRNKDAFLLLRGVLTDKSRLVIIGSIPLFVKYNSAESLNLITSHLKNDDLDIKKQAIKTLGYIGNIDTINAIAPFMNEKEPSLRLEAIKAASLIIKRGGIFFTTDIDADYEKVRKINGLNSAEKLTGKLIPIIKKIVTDSKNSKEKEEFLTCLSLLAKTYLDKLNTYIMFEEDEKLISKANKVRGMIFSLMPGIIKTFALQEDLVRWSIVKLLREYQDKATVPVFITGLKDSYYPVRVSSVEGLRALNYRDSMPYILTLLKDDVDIVRVAVIQAAITFKSIELVESIIPPDSDSDNQITWNATKALGALFDARAIPYLKSVAQSKESFLRAIAINSLGEIGFEDSLYLVIIASEDSSPLVREAAVNALRRFGSVEITYTSLLGLTRDQNRYVRLAALQAVDYFMKGNVSDAIRKALISAVIKLSNDEELQIRIKSGEIIKDQNK